MPQFGAPVANWGDAIRVALTSALVNFFAFIPALIGAVLILILGWFVANLIGRLTSALLRRVRFNEVADRAEIDQFLSNAGVRSDPAEVVGLLAKWFVFFIFLTAAFNALALPEVTAILNSILLFIPNLIVALVILLVGALVANLLAGLVQGAVIGAGLGHAALFASAARWSVMAFTLLMALDQLQIAPSIVDGLWMALLGMIALGLAIAFGLGAREAVGSVATGQLLRSELKSGEQISIDGQSGTIESIGALYTAVRLPGGLLRVPNGELARSRLTTTPSAPANGPAADRSEDLSRFA
jgi:hypothetical protein